MGLSFFGLILLGCFILFLVCLSYFDTKESGIFKQKRIGQYAKSFTIFKIRTLKDLSDGSKKATKLGRFLRVMKWDELPQLWNVLIGDMSFVGPRPDMEGYADNLKENDKIILSVKPGITGPATLYFKNEESILSKQSNPEAYNDTVIWPKKVELNKRYIAQYSFYEDIKIILKTLFMSFRPRS